MESVDAALALAEQQFPGVHKQLMEYTADGRHGWGVVLWKADASGRLSTGDAETLPNAILAALKNAGASV